MVPRPFAAGLPSGDPGSSADGLAHSDSTPIQRKASMATAVDPNPGIKSERHPLDTTCINTIRTLVDGRGSGRQFGAPRHADGHGPRGLLPLAVRPAVRPGRPGLAQPRPLRALGRPRLDAALFAAAPDRASRRSARTTSRWASRRSRSRRSSSSGSSTAGARAIRSTG